MKRRAKPYFNKLEKTAQWNKVEQGDILAVKGIYGIRFEFSNHVRNIETGAEWIDCWELWRGRKTILRSFHCDKIKVLPKRRRRNGRNKTSGKAS